MMMTSPVGRRAVGPLTGNYDQFLDNRIINFKSVGQRQAVNYPKTSINYSKSVPDFLRGGDMTMTMGWGATYFTKKKMNQSPPIATVASLHVPTLIKVLKTILHRPIEERFSVKVSGACQYFKLRY